MSRKWLPFGLLPCIGDFEASGLTQDSYPIEVAWSLPSGAIQSHLIQPDPAWGGYWNPDSEALHHITQKMLENEGIAPVMIAAKMNSDLRGLTLYFDGSDYDLKWLTLLYEAAGIPPTFNFGHFETLLAAAGVEDASRQIAAENLARRDVGDLQLHRAANEVRLLQRWYIRTRVGMRY